MDLLVPQKYSKSVRTTGLWSLSDQNKRAAQEEKKCDDYRVTKTRPKKAFSFIFLMWAPQVQKGNSFLILNEPRWSAVTCQFSSHFLLNVSYWGNLGSGSKSFIWFHDCREISSEGPCKVVRSPASKSSQVFKACFNFSSATASFRRELWLCKAQRYLFSI